VKTDRRNSPAARAMDAAIELAIEGQSPYPDRATFIDANEPEVGQAIKKAIDEGCAVVLAYADGATRVLRSVADGSGPGTT
jgi:hypothetical protein